jgi:hypothetical protein
MNEQFMFDIMIQLLIVIAFPTFVISVLAERSIKRKRTPKK